VALDWNNELDRLDASYRVLCDEVASVRELPARLGVRPV
jgi:hypothetical protein